MKKELTPTLLFIMQSILDKYPKYDYIRVESWSHPKTLKIMIEVAVGDEKSSN
ncbi:unnamed protein product [marine sediment metagenome]|uniref:Uncharacterized protein n=1 Tax=marine sediment metagenome TaxID=412755 RepID=X1JAE4_9ZZZZ